MKLKFPNKRITTRNNVKMIAVNSRPIIASATKPKNKRKKDSDMTAEQIAALEAAAMEMNKASEVKVVKKDRGLIERTESSKIILTEDNRQVLND